MFALLLVPPPALLPHTCRVCPLLGWSGASLPEPSYLLRFWQGILVHGLQQPLSGALSWQRLASAALGRATVQAPTEQLRAFLVFWTSSCSLCWILEPLVLVLCQQVSFLALLCPGHVAGQAEQPAAVLHWWAPALLGLHLCAVMLHGQT